MTDYREKLAELSLLDNKTNTFLWNGNFASISCFTLDALEAMCNDRESPQMRINFHKSHNDHTQQMLMILAQNCEILPHFQNRGAVSYTVLRGEAELKLTENRVDYETHRLALHKIQFIKLPRSTIRHMRATTDYFFFVETCDGPFIREETIWV